MGFIKEKVVKGLLFLLSICFFPNEPIEEGRPAEKALDAVVRTFEKKMGEKFSLKCCSLGAGMPHDIEKVIIGFSTQKTATIEDARKIAVYFMEEFLAIINQDEDVRPYLREYPFTNKRVFLTFSFRLEGSPDKQLYVSLLKNQIFYDTRREIGKGFIEVFKEPYEEALNLVRKI